MFGICLWLLVNVCVFAKYTLAADSKDRELKLKIALPSRSMMMQLAVITITTTTRSDKYLFAADC
jgi:hypothetical protein